MKVFSSEATEEGIKCNTVRIPFSGTLSHHDLGRALYCEGEVHYRLGEDNGHQVRVEDTWIERNVAATCEL